MPYLLLFLVLFPPLTLAEVTTDGTLGARVQLDAPDYRISPDLGQQVNTTLFHSFETFSLDANETATFIGLPQLELIVSRVTGEHLSHINGLIQTEGLTGEDAGFFFINPNGIIFGEHAQLDLNGSVFFSTADTLYLTDEEGQGQGEFNATHPENTLLSVSNPSAFGFLDHDIAPLTINGSQLEVVNGSLFGAVAGGIYINNGATISTPSVANSPTFNPVEGNDDIELSSGIALVSVGSAGTLFLEGAEEELILTFEQQEGSEIPLLSFNQDPNKVLVNFDGEQFGDIEINNNSHLIADSEGNSASLVYLQGKQVKFDNHSSISANSYGNQTEDTLGNYIWLLGDELILDHDSRIYGQKRSGTGFGSGLLAVIKEDIRLLNRSGIKLDTLSEGNAGNANIFTKNLYMENSFMNSASVGTGDGGSIWIQATESIRLKGDDTEIVQQAESFLSRVKHIDTPEEQQAFIDGLSNIQIVDIAKLSGDSIGQGNAGAIFLLTDQFNADTFMLTSEAVNGNAGGIFIQATDIKLKDFMISSSVLTRGNGGKVVLNADNTLVAQRGLFLSAAGDDASAGNVDMLGDVLYFDHANISTSARRSGGGDIRIDADRTLLFRNAEILASVAESVGDGGDINIAFPFYMVANKSSLLAQASGGHGGNISIQAHNLITSDDSVVDASSERGVDGEVTIQAPDVNFNEATLVFKPQFLELDMQIRDMCRVRLIDQLPTEFQLDYSFIVSPFSGQYSQIEDWQPSFTRQTFSQFKRRLSDLARCSLHDNAVYEY
ncbi:filamentous hemagglutinin N-terminal domain-containing protein [Candidatus Albibeggiatoa sp. nov. NOAA]|uniref:two-partner secretion domain-containing protein n=1 Tax=Candidatus Albibeggiatoa sp. nov. NOAA TaxID=3162724 RepID=UPI0032F22ADF|nr:filamentous hemagglutinin N-terminal domain-containing protein [Thiotrichaceae bacterium]